MKSILLSIRPQWCELIANGKKTLEIRKTRPKLDTPFKCYIYCTVSAPVLWRNEKPMNGKVVGEFVCDDIKCFDVPYPAFQDELDKSILEQSCCTYYMLHRYAYHDALYGWHISDLKIYDKPRELQEFWKAGKCEYATDAGCSYKYHCARAGKLERCGEQLTRPPVSWYYVEDEL